MTSLIYRWPEVSLLVLAGGFFALGEILRRWA